MELRKPYRVNVFATKLVAGRRYKSYTVLELCHYGYSLWNPEQNYQEARLPSAGSFLFPGIHRVRDAAIAALALPGTHQVSIRTNQDQRVYVFNKDVNGHVSGYLNKGDC